MTKRVFAFLVVFAAFLFIVPVAEADGIIIPVPRPPLPPTTPMDNLAIEYHRVQVMIRDQHAVTEIDQVFRNDADYEIEGIYMFPLPEGASISDFSMTVDGKEIKGTLLDAEEARRIYEETVRRQRDPALLEYVGQSAFRARIYPIPAQSERRIQIRYEELLPMDSGLVRYLYPLNTERFSSEPIEDVSIHVDLEATRPIRALYSPSHEIGIFRTGDRQAEIGYEAHQVLPDRDFTLYYALAERQMGVHVLSFKEVGKDGFFTALIVPPLHAERRAMVAKDVILVLDTSGSMRGAKLQQAKDALDYVLDHLNAEDRFNILTFSTGTRRFARRLQERNERPYAKEFVSRLKAGGGTNIERALTEALAMSDTSRPQIVIFLTDGLATEGIVATDEILRRVEDAAPEATRLFTFGIGDEVNTMLLDSLAEAHRGASAYVRPHQSITEEVSAFYQKVGAPVLADVALEIEGILVEELYPYPLPDLYAGSQLVVTGRYRQGGTASLSLRGQVDGYDRDFLYDDVRFAQQGGADFVPRLWATRKIGHLLKSIRLHGESPELIDEVIGLSLRYGIMTPYTAFLVDETEDVLSTEARADQAEKLGARMAEDKQIVSGAKAVERSIWQNELTESEAPQAAPEQEAVRQFGDRTFLRREGIWMDTTYIPDQERVITIPFGSEAYFELLDRYSQAGRYLAVSQHVIVKLDGQAYQIVPEKTAKASPTRTRPAEIVPSATHDPSLTVTPTPTVYPDPTPRPGPSLWRRVQWWLQSLVK